MKTNGNRTCPVCGTLFTENSDPCPVCALRGALETQSDSLSGISSELRFEHYTVLQNADGTPGELGRGAMGITYKAFDVHLERPVVLKIINARFIGDDSARRRFVREARAAASVRHPNVASVFHLGESEGNYFYVMEFEDATRFWALKVKIIGLQVIGRFFLDVFAFFWGQLGTQSRSNCLGDFALDGKNVCQIPVIAIGPNRVVIADID